LSAPGTSRLSLVDGGHHQVKVGLGLAEEQLSEHYFQIRFVVVAELVAGRQCGRADVGLPPKAVSHVSELRGTTVELQCGGVTIEVEIVGHDGNLENDG